jgi:hypothetical protein
LKDLAIKLYPVGMHGLFSIQVIGASTVIIDWQVWSSDHEESINGFCSFRNSAMAVGVGEDYRNSASFPYTVTVGLLGHEPKAVFPWEIAGGYSYDRFSCIPVICIHTGWLPRDYRIKYGEISEMKQAQMFSASSSSRASHRFQAALAR